MIKKEIGEEHKNQQERFIKDKDRRLQRFFKKNTIITITVFSQTFRNLIYLDYG